MVTRTIVSVASRGQRTLNSLVLLDRTCTYYTLAGSPQASRPINMVSPGPSTSANVLRKAAASSRPKFPGNVVSGLDSQNPTATDSPTLEPRLRMHFCLVALDGSFSQSRPSS